MATLKTESHPLYIPIHILIAMLIFGALLKFCTPDNNTPAVDNPEPMSDCHVAEESLSKGQAPVQIINIKLWLSLTSVVVEIVLDIMRWWDDRSNLASDSFHNTQANGWDNLVLGLGGISDLGAMCYCCSRCRLDTISDILLWLIWRYWVNNSWHKEVGR